MNLVDLFILIALGLFVFEGIRKGFLAEVLDILTFILAFLISFRFYDLLSGLLTNTFGVPLTLSKILGFLILWFISETLILTLINYFFVKIQISENLNKKLNYLTFIPALFRGLILISLTLLLIATFPIQPQVKAMVSDSVLGSAILDKTQKFETPIRQSLGGLSSDTLTFFTIKPKSDETVKLGFTLNQFSENSYLEDEMLKKVNLERKKRGLLELKADTQLRKVALGHSSDMFKRGYFAHYSPEGKNVSDRASEMNVTFLTIGENLAYAPNLEVAHTGLMNSEGHRANILSTDYSRIGIGIMDGGVYGLMVTQVFGD